MGDPEIARYSGAKPSEARRQFVTWLTRWAWSFPTLDECVRFAELERREGLGELISAAEAEFLAKQIYAREYPERIETDPVSAQELVSVKDLREKTLTLFREGGDRGVSTGWHGLDSLYRVRRGELTILTGAPGSGKTSFLDALLVNLIRYEAWRVGIFSAEQWPLERHILGLAEKLTGQPARPGPTEMMREETLRAALNALDDAVVFLCPRDQARSLDRILTIAQEAVVTKGLFGVVIDPWNAIDHQRHRDLSETEYVSASVTKIQRFAQSHLVHVWLVAHPTKMQRDKQGAYPVATMYDISGSAHFFNKTDNGISVYRHKDDPEKPVEIHVQKIRFRDVGQLGTAYLRYLPASGGFLDA